MGYDITNPPPPMPFRPKVGPINGLTARVFLYDPIQNQPAAVQVTSRNSTAITVRVQCVEYPRLLIIQE